jgi:hypothetical protein
VDQRATPTRSAEALGLVADLAMVEIAEFGRDLLAKNTGDCGRIHE